MKCDNCEREATVLLLDRKRVEVRQFRPGMIIPCDDPRTVQTYCDDCWTLKTLRNGLKSDIEWLEKNVL